MCPLCGAGAQQKLSFGEKWYENSNAISKNFDDQSFAGLRNILRNGGRCGIYTLIIASPSTITNGRQDEFSKGLKAIEGLTSIIQYSDGAFIMRGMPLLYLSMPEKSEFNKFFGKYMLPVKIIHYICRIKNVEKVAFGIIV